MNDRDGYPENVPCWIDTGRVDDQAAMDFYGGLFGWEFENLNPDGSDAPAYNVARLGGREVAAIGAQPEMDWDPVWNTYVWVSDADDFLERAKAAGATAPMGVIQAGPAGRFAAVMDPAGAWISAWQAQAHRGAAAINEPAAWVFSDLRTPDPDAAERFYNELFGWELTSNGDGTAMIRRPGYAKEIAKWDPEFEQRLADYHAPEGFGDVVARMATATDGNDAARWGVTFSVDDADQAAARAVELGGAVIVEPHDSEWTRDAVLSDIDGVEFQISKFTPPSE